MSDRDDRSPLSARQRRLHAVALMAAVLGAILGAIAIPLGSAHWGIRIGLLVVIVLLLFLAGIAFGLASKSGQR